MDGWMDGFLESLEVGFYRVRFFLFFSSLFVVSVEIFSCILHCHSSFFFFLSLHIFCSIFCILFCPFTIHILFLFISFLLVYYLELL